MVLCYDEQKPNFCYLCGQIPHRGEAWGSMRAAAIRKPVPVTSRGSGPGALRDAAEHLKPHNQTALMALVYGQINGLKRLWIQPPGLRQRAGDGASREVVEAGANRR